MTAAKPPAPLPVNAQSAPLVPPESKASVPGAAGAAQGTITGAAAPATAANAAPAVATPLKPVIEATPPAVAKPDEIAPVTVVETKPAPAAVQTKPAPVLAKSSDKAGALPPEGMQAPAKVATSQRAKPAADDASAVADKPIAPNANARSTQPGELHDNEAAAPKAPAARPRAKGQRDLMPSVSAQARSAEVADGDEHGASGNIDKQVRAPSHRDRAESRFQQGMEAFDAGSLAQAESSWHEALEQDPMFDKARQALLGLYVEAGRREDAAHLLGERLQLDPKHAGFAMALARLQLDGGANGDALATLQRSLPYGETIPDYHALLANALSRVARHKEAAERFDAASRLAPRNAVWLLGLGMELRADGRNKQARTAFARARELGGLTPQLAAYLDQQLRELQ
jgi:MSHA biogenesis protein MshN